MVIKTEDIYHCLFQFSADGLIVSDAEGHILLCNQALANFVGRSADELKGAKLSSIISGDLISRNGEAQKHSTVGDGIKSDVRIQEHNQSLPRLAAVQSRVGMELTMPASHIPIYADANINNAKTQRPNQGEESCEVSGADSCGKLLTSGKDREAGAESDRALIKGYLTIVYLVQGHSVQQAQTEFVSTVSHELRTPLTSIKGFADTILRAGDRLDANQQKRYVTIIKDQADRLTRLVEDLLAVSRLESKRMQMTIRAIDLNDAVLRVLRNLTNKARFHKIINNIPSGLPHVWADADRLEQILTNLIDNAIKYSPQNSTVTITARDVAGPPEIIEFCVIDEGVGIDNEHIAEIFNKFSRLDNPLTRQTEGTGLGLYITRSLVFALSGQIKVASRPGSTTFTVQLPAASLEQQAARGRG